MKLLKNFHSDDFDLAIFGIGFESRSIDSVPELIKNARKSIAMGYSINTEIFNYQSNLSTFRSYGATIIEGDDTQCLAAAMPHIQKATRNGPANILVDISVMSRHKFSSLLYQIMQSLHKGSKLSITYSLSEFIQPPDDATPIRYLGEIIPPLIGSLGDLSMPSSVIFCLGYEPGKASGVVNYLDPDCVYLFIPNSPIPEFKQAVEENNSELIANTPESNIFEYDVCNPYSTYLSLRSLTLSIREFSRPLIIPLGPKIIASLSLILGIELTPELPIWRVSSELLEKPVDRKASGYKIQYTVEI